MTESTEGDPREIPDHLAQYLARRALDGLPASVYDTLLSLSPEELEVLESGVRGPALRTTTSGRTDVRGVRAYLRRADERSARTCSPTTS